jgi:hypothetical protein
MRRGNFWLVPHGGSKPRRSSDLNAVRISIGELLFWFGSPALLDRALVNGTALRLRHPASIPNAFFCAAAAAWA